MSLVPKYHELGTKNLLDLVVLPPAVGTQTDPTTAACNDYSMGDLDQALDAIFYHPNLGPFICRQLIQRLVTSSPSPAYLYRVSNVFDDDGSAQHVRGNLAAVVRAILLDGEARNPALATASTGKQREPILRVTGPARTFLYNGVCRHVRAEREHHHYHARGGVPAEPAGQRRPSRAGLQCRHDRDASRAPMVEPNHGQLHGAGHPGAHDDLVLHQPSGMRQLRLLRDRTNRHAAGQPDREDGRAEHHHECGRHQDLSKGVPTVPACRVRA